MKQYELYRENSYGNVLIAVFVNRKELNEYINKFKPPEKHSYFIIVVETNRIRISVETFRKLNKFEGGK